MMSIAYQMGVKCAGSDLSASLPYLLGGAGIGGLSGYLLEGKRNRVRNAILGALAGAAGGYGVQRVMNSPAMSAIKGTRDATSPASTGGKPTDTSSSKANPAGTPSRLGGILGMMVPGAASVGYMKKVFDPANSRSLAPHEEQAFENMKNKTLSDKVVGVVSHVPSALDKQIGPNFNNDLKRIYVANKNPETFAHEVGHAVRASKGQFLSKGMNMAHFYGPGVGTVGALGFNDPALGGLSAAAGTMVSLPRLVEEFQASRLAANMLRGQGLRGRGGYRGLPTYLLNAAVPAAAWLGKHGPAYFGEAKNE